MRTLWNSLLIIFLGTLLAGQAHGQTIYVTNTGDGTAGAGCIGEYGATTGATINASLVSGLSSPAGIAVSGGNLWVANLGSATVGEYNATTGAPINASLLTGTNHVQGVAVSGGNLYCNVGYFGPIGEYVATTGAAVNASLVDQGLNNPDQIAISGGYLYVANSNIGTVGKYDATTGAAVNVSLVSGLNYPTGIAVSGGTLWVSSTSGNGLGAGYIGEYDANTGAATNPSLISGLTAPIGIAVLDGKLYVTLYYGSPGNVNGIGTIGVYDATTGSPINTSLVSGLNGPLGIAIVPPAFVGQIQQPINLDGSSVFSVKRGVVPVKFTLTSGGLATCQLPPATISLMRNTGGTPGPIDESTYLLPSDSGSNFRADTTSCQYVYNLATSSLGPGMYTVNILIGGNIVGNATLALK